MSNDDASIEIRREFNDMRQGDLRDWLASWMVQAAGMTVRDLEEMLPLMVGKVEDLYRRMPPIED